MSLLNFLRYIFQLEDVEFVKQISIFYKNEEINTIYLDEVNMKSWTFDYMGSELKLHFFNHESMKKLPRQFHNKFEIFRLVFREARITNIRLEKSTQYDFCHLMINERDNLYYYFKMFIPSDKIQDIKDYLNDKSDLKNKIEFVKFE